MMMMMMTTTTVIMSFITTYIYGIRMKAVIPNAFSLHCGIAFLFLLPLYSINGIKLETHYERPAVKE
jgi:hypothetical protein